MNWVVIEKWLSISCALIIKNYKQDENSARTFTDYKNRTNINKNHEFITELLSDEEYAAYDKIKGL